MSGLHTRANFYWLDECRSGFIKIEVAAMGACTRVLKCPISGRKTSIKYGIWIWKKEKKDRDEEYILKVFTKK